MQPAPAGWVPSARAPLLWIHNSGRKLCYSWTFILLSVEQVTDSAAIGYGLRILSFDLFSMVLFGIVLRAKIGDHLGGTASLV